MHDCVSTDTVLKYSVRGEASRSGLRQMPILDLKYKVFSIPFKIASDRLIQPDLRQPARGRQAGRLLLRL